MVACQRPIDSKPKIVAGESAMPMIGIMQGRLPYDGRFKDFSANRWWYRPARRTGANPVRITSAISAASVGSLVSAYRARARRPSIKTCG
jgi:hypothetical protein